jgi:hypothetical protein
LHFMWRRVPRIKRFFVTPVEKINNSIRVCLISDWRFY